MSYLIAIIAALIGYLFYSNTKRKSAEALLENNNTLAETNKADNSIAKNNGLLEAEEEKRKQALEQAKKEKEKNESPEDLAKYFNNH